MTIAEVLDLDALTFDAYVRAITRTTTAQRIADTWTTHIASQGATKSVKKWIKTLTTEAGLDREPENQKNDAAALFKLFKGKGL